MPKRYGHTLIVYVHIFTVEFSDGILWYIKTRQRDVVVGLKFIAW